MAAVGRALADMTGMSAALARLRALFVRVGRNAAVGVGILAGGPDENWLPKQFETMYSQQFFRQGDAPNTWTTVDPAVVPSIRFGLEMFHKKHNALGGDNAEDPVAAGEHRVGPWMHRETVSFVDKGRYSIYFVKVHGQTDYAQTELDAGVENTTRTAPLIIMVHTPADNGPRVATIVLPCNLLLPRHTGAPKMRAGVPNYLNHDDGPTRDARYVLTNLGLVPQKNPADAVVFKVPVGWQNDYFLGGKANLDWHLAKAASLSQYEFLVQSEGASFSAYQLPTTEMREHISAYFVAQFTQGAGAADVQWRTNTKHTASVGGCRITMYAIKDSRVLAHMLMILHQEDTQIVRLVVPCPMALPDHRGAMRDPGLVAQLTQSVATTPVDPNIRSYLDNTNIITL